jgi:multidrug efflux pump subunit AcrB
MLVAVTTVLGMIPLLQDPFFSAMAVTIMFGLAFACFLTMIVVPVLYSIFFNAKEPRVTIEERMNKAYDEAHPRA